MDSSVAVAHDTVLSHFAGSTYRPSACEMRQVDMLLLAALAVIQIFWPPPADSSETAARGSLYVLVLLAGAWYVATRNPFLPHDTWKLYVKVGSLLLAALAAVLTHETLVEALQASGSTNAGPDVQPTASAARTGLSYAVFVGCMLLLATLAVGFCSSSISGARLHGRLQRALSKPQRHPFARNPVSVVGAHSPTLSGGLGGGSNVRHLSGALAVGGAGNPLLLAGVPVGVRGKNHAESTRQTEATPSAGPALQGSSPPLRRKSFVQEADGSDQRFTPATPSAFPLGAASKPARGAQSRRSTTDSPPLFAEVGDRTAFRQMAVRRLSLDLRRL
jgi:hypothetical protein